VAILDGSGAMMVSELNAENVIRDTHGHHQLDRRRLERFT
jgi:hypothetical protein